MKLGPNQQKWVDALRSGEYEQGKGWLCSGAGFCCLGVATDVFGVQAGRGTWEHYPVLENTYIYKESGTGNDRVLPPSVCTILGLKNCMGEFTSFVERGTRTYTALTTLNDSGVSFEEIADIIEDRADELFEEPR